MGDRANYALVGENGYELFHSQWGALTIDRNLLDGPDAAIEFVREQRADGHWLDDVWCGADRSPARGSAALHLAPRRRGTQDDLA